MYQFIYSVACIKQPGLQDNEISALVFTTNTVCRLSPVAGSNYIVEAPLSFEANWS